MAENTKIEWADHSASPWHGCSEVHVGCDNCYARTMAKRNPGTLGVWGKDGTRVMSASFTKNCRRWNADAKKRGVIESVFPSICDPFEDWQGPILDSGGAQKFTDGGRWNFSDKVRPLTMDDLRRDLFALIDECQSLRFLLLTKRPENVRRMWPSADVFDSKSEHKAYWPNVALLASVSDQTTADAMIPPLLKCRDLVPTLGVSLEPMLGPIHIEPHLTRDYEPMEDYAANDGIDWVIVGGESGHGARPMHPQWVRSIRDQCVEAGVPFFFKQRGEFTWDKPVNPCDEWGVLDRGGNYGSHITAWNGCTGDDSETGEVYVYRAGKKAAGRLLDGRTWDELPQPKAVPA